MYRKKQLRVTLTSCVPVGWNPCCTIMFVHWDAQEQALMGSYEFVEEHYKELSDRTVAYINLDVAVRGKRI